MTEKPLEIQMRIKIKHKDKMKVIFYVAVVAVVAHTLGSIARGLAMILAGGN